MHCSVVFPEQHRQRIYDAASYLTETIGKAPLAWRNMLNSAVDDMYNFKTPAAKGHHHVYPGGLLVHTAEVLKYALALCPEEEDVLIPAAILHDVEKVSEYAWDKTEDGTIVVKDLPFRHNFGHVVGSVTWIYRTNNWLANHGLRRVDEVIHAMLAHHGRLEWGSPVTPQTRAAWALHLADMMSAQAGEGK